MTSAVGVYGSWVVFKRDKLRTGTDVGMFVGNYSDRIYRGTAAATCWRLFFGASAVNCEAGVSFRRGTSFR